MNPMPPTNTVTQAEQSSFHIAFCVDNHYFRAMGATILSIIVNNPGVHFTFHVLAFAVADAHRARLLKLEAEYPVKTHIHIVSPDLFSQFSHFIASTYYSPAIFTRLAIPDVLQEYTDKVLYLDADILCVGKLDELMALPMDEQIAYVVPDAEATTVRRAAALKLSQVKYFNSGVLYMNIKQWRAHRITEATIEAMLKGGNDFRFPDQDALNIALDGKATYIAKRWNYLYGLIGDLENDRRAMYDVGDAVFIHFAGAVKPWADWCLHDSRAIFAKYHGMSPWADMPMDQQPQNYKEMRMHSRFLLKRKQLGASIKWFWKYLLARPR
ncbi:glycosyltransferase family 8 protein [Solimicrobium silvestre]|uniref:Lipopolysaccharide biosynthesis protein LPS:glycosyltransferase n=1 Tax=Solimicrobium silvestre TaxID=2099400 RepID=A0A2S9GYM8_9BURK|nr:glycosyltransferase [Solimicrobium silvestre]PRC92813.1 Lipopolysaccharide biosynthesis protein LPS:glycosyltransferase [Solimicrobium silvestre]